MGNNKEYLSIFERAGIKNPYSVYQIDFLNSKSNDYYYKGFKLVKNEIEREELRFKEAYVLWTYYEYSRNAKLDIQKRKKHPFSECFVSSFRKHTVPLHDLKMKDITMFDIQELIDDCEYGHTVRRYIKQLSKTLFQFCNAVFGKYLEVDFFKNIVIGKEYKSNKYKLYPENEIAYLWSSFSKQENGEIFISDILDMILISLYIPLRTSAFLSIEIEKVFLDKDYIVGGNKTEAGTNIEIPIHPKIKPLIEKRFNESNKYLFQNSLGNSFNRNYYEKKFNKVMSQLGLDHLPYDNRKTIATCLTNMNVKDLIIKQLMGHSIKDVTEKHYIEVTLAQKKEANNLLHSHI